ncbi:MAG: hypothetical protein GX800_01040 [Clostridiaceae bacterium]|nr:hypothetical protein [Clostridiaceae bacterium]
MKGRLSYEEDGQYLVECTCGLCIRFKARSFDEAEQLLKDAFWDITKSDCVKMPYAKCGLCIYKTEGKGISAATLIALTHKHKLKAKYE